MVLEFDRFRRYADRGRRRSDGYFTDGIHSGGGSGGWVLMGGQIRHEGCKIVAVRVDFIAEFALEVCFERSDIKGDEQSVRGIGPR